MAPASRHTGNAKLRIMKTTSQLKHKSILLLATLAIAMPLGVLAQGSGNVSKQERELPAFTSIEAGSAFTIVLEQGSPSKVVVETDDNYQEKIETTVSGDKLTISSLGMKNPTLMKVWITAPEIKEMEIYGAARLSSTGVITASKLDLELSGATRVELDLNVEELDSDLSGAAKVILKGNATRHDADISGAVNLNAFGLKTLTSELDLSGASKASVNALNQLSASLSGASSLSYYDEDQVKKISKTGDYNITPVSPSEKPDVAVADSETVTVNIDSTIINIGDIEVKVEDGDKTRVIIGGNELEVDEDGNVKFKKTKRQTRYDGHWGGFELGVNGYVNKDRQFDMPEGYDFLDLRMEKSINVKLNFFEQNFNLIANKFGFTTGLGFEWNNYRFNDDVLLKKDGTDLINANDFEPVNYSKSKLVVNYLNLPLMFEYQTNRFSKKNSFHIGAGLQTGLRIGAHTKVVYQEDGRKKKDKDPGDFHLNPFKYDLMVRVGWGKLNLHANYSLNTLFKNNRGPELYPFTVGISLVSW